MDFLAIENLKTQKVRDKTMARPWRSNHNFIVDLDDGIGNLQPQGGMVRTTPYRAEIEMALFFQMRLVLL